jgi:hypothetical protein
MNDNLDFASRRRRAICVTAFLGAALAAGVAGASPGLAQTQVPTPPANRPQAPDPQQSDRFDYLVRADYFRGIAGDQAAFDRAMKTCEDALAKDPRNAQAMVWHGAGVLFLGGQAFRRGDFNNGTALWNRGLKQMDDAVALAPDEVGVLIPRGATLLSAARHQPSQEAARAILVKGVGDYEKVLLIQQPYFQALPVHARCELLTGLAKGWHQLGETEKSRGYFQRIVQECVGSDYAEEASSWLSHIASGKPQESSTCHGCHAE